MTTRSCIVIFLLAQWQKYQEWCSRERGLIKPTVSRRSNNHFCTLSSRHFLPRCPPDHTMLSPLTSVLPLLDPHPHAHAPSLSDEVREGSEGLFSKNSEAKKSFVAVL